MRVRQRFGAGALGLVVLGLLVSARPARADVITTTFASNNGQDGNMFDVLTGPRAITVTGFDLNLVGGTTSTIQIYEKPGTWVGFDHNSAAWTLLATVLGVVSAGTNQPTHINVPNFTLPANASTALYLTDTHTTGFNFLYTNGTAVGAVAASNADLSILQGAGKQYPFGSTFTPRIWNGSIYYTPVAAVVPEPSTLALLGLSVLGLAGWLRWRRRGAGHGACLMA